MVEVSTDPAVVGDKEIHLHLRHPKEIMVRLVLPLTGAVGVAQVEQQQVLTALMVRHHLCREFLPYTQVAAVDRQAQPLLEPVEPVVVVRVG